MKLVRNEVQGDPHAAVEWLKVVLALVTTVALVVIYLLLPVQGGPTIDLIRNLIPNAVTTLLVVPVVFVILTRAGVGLEQRIIRAVREGLAGSEEPQLVFPDDVGEIAPLIREIVAKKIPRRKLVRIEVVAFTGGTFTTAVLRELINTHPGRLQVIMHSIDFTVVDGSALPAHWPAEASATEKRLKDLCERKAELEILHFQVFPFILGLLVDDTDLFLAFSSWNFKTQRVADAKNEYRYYRRTTQTEHLFRLFANWANQPRQVQIYPDNHE